jgi:dynein heavy chain
MPVPHLHHLPLYCLLVVLQAEAFRQYQGEIMEVVKSQLWTSWAPKSVEIFNRIPPVFINGDSDAYYRSVATLQGNQLRSLVSRSLNE